MSERHDKISFSQLFMMFALMNGLSSHVIVNPMILETAKRDSWLAAVAAGVLFMLWIVLLWLLMRATRQEDWRGWLSRRFSPFVAWLLVAPLCLQLYLIGAMTVIHTSTWHISNYLPTSPSINIIVSLVVFCTILSLWGLRAIAVASGILLPLVVVLGIFVSLFNSPLKDYALLTPIMENGAEPVLHGMIYGGAGFVELIVIMAIQHRLRSPVKLWQLWSYGAFSIMITIGPLIGAVTEFGPVEAAHQMVSPYEQWRLVQIGQFIEHLDFLSIFQWLAGACLRISLSVYLLLELFRIRRSRTRYGVVIAIMASYILIALLPIEEYTFYLWMLRYYMPLSLAILSGLSVLWLIATQAARKMGGRNPI